MARQLSAVPDIDPPDSDYPAGKIRNEDPPTDGTPVIEELYGDIIQFFHKLMRLAGVSYNDIAENESAGFQFIEAMATYVRTLSATTSQKGTSELATSAETQAGIDATRTVTPAGLTSRTATETRTGILELATNTEVQTGTDTSRAVTPAGLSSRTATTTKTGILETATQTEANALSATDKIVTPGVIPISSLTQEGIVEIATSSQVNNSTDIEPTGGQLVVQPSELMRVAGGLLTTIVEIGDWNMDVDATKTIAHGLTFNDIRSIKVIIRDDSNSALYDLPCYNYSTGYIEGAIDAINSTNVILWRRNSGFFDSSLFNSTSYNRGWIVVNYLP